MEHDLDLTAPYRAEDRSAEQSLTALSHLAEQSAKITAVVARGQENVNVGYMILGFQPDLDRSSQQTREKWQSIRSGVGALMQANQQMFYNMADIVKELRQIASRCAQLQEDIESSTLNQAQAKAALAMIDQVLKNVESAREHVNGITRLDSDLFEKVASDSSSFLKEVGAEWVTLKSNTIRELRQRLDDLDREEIAKYEQVWTVRTDAAQKKARAEQSSIEVAQLREHLEFTRSRRRLIQEQQRLLEAKTEAEIERLQGQVSSLAADLARRQEEMREASVQRLKDVEAAYKKRQEEIQASTAALQQELQNIK